MNLLNKEERQALIGKKYFTLTHTLKKGVAEAEILQVGFLGDTDKLGCKIRIGKTVRVCEIKNNHVILPSNERRYVNISLVNDEIKN